MRDFMYFQLLFYVATGLCVDTAVYTDLSSQLTLEECRELVASLYYPGNQFPTTMEDYLEISTTGCDSPTKRSSSKDDLCIQLLLEWDKKAGMNSTHVFIERRLRQMNRMELADWLGKTVFHQLATEINDTLLQNPFADSNEELPLNLKVLEDKTLLQVNDKLTRFDFVLRFMVFILFVILIVVCCTIVGLSCVRRNGDQVQEEMRNLIQNKNINEN